MKLMPMIIHSLVLLAGLICLYIAWQQFQKTHLLLSKGITATATVIENRPEKVKNNTMYRPRFQYMNQNHQPVQFSGKVVSSPPAWSVGETTLVVYRPDDSTSVRIVSYWNLYSVTILLTALAAPFLVIGLGYFAYSFYARSLVNHF
jgi:Protein of unknown function (DUF3592)